MDHEANERAWVALIARAEALQKQGREALAFARATEARRRAARKAAKGGTR